MPELRDLLLLLCAPVVFLGGPLMAWGIYCWGKERGRRKVAERRADARHAATLHVINVSIHTAPGDNSDLFPTVIEYHPLLGPLTMPMDLEPAAFYDAMMALRRISRPTAIGPWASLPLPSGEYLEGACLEILAEAVSTE